MDRLTNILKIVENQRLGYNVPKQVDLAYSKLKCLAGDLKFFYDDNERLFSPVFTSKFCPIKGYENYMISANEEGKVCLIDTDAPRGKKVIASFQAHVNAIYDLAWVNQNVSFISAAADQSANLWQLVEGRVQSVHQFLGHTHSVKAVTCMPDDANVFATGGRDGSLIVWDKRVQSSAHEISPSTVEPYKIINHSHEDKSFFKPRKCGSQKTSVTGLVFQDTDNLISCSAGDGLIKVWDMRKTYCVKKRMPQPKHTLVYNGEGKNGFSYLAISPCRLRLYANCIDNFVYCYDVGTYKEKPIGVYGGLKGSSFYIKNAVSPDGRYIATGSSDAKAYVWSTTKQVTPIVSLSGHSAEVTCVDWCKAGEVKMVSCSDDSTIRVWRLHPEEIACNDPMLRGWAERHSFIIHKKPPKNEQPTPKRKHINSDMKTPPKHKTEQNNENISPEIRQAEKKQCRGGSSSIDMSSLTADLPNFVIDGTSPHNHRCSHRPKPKENNWLSKLKDRASGSRPQQLTVRRKSSSNNSSPARDSLLKFFKVSSSRSSNICEQPSISSPDPNNKTPPVKV